MGMLKITTAVLLIWGVSGVLSSGGQSLQGGYQTQQEGSELEGSEAVSEVEYVDGPLAPLYDFLIQRRLHKFCKLLRDAGLEDVLQGLGGYWTVFVPTDASFIFLPGGTLEDLRRNPQLLRDFLLYHFVTGDFPSSQVLNEMLVDSVQGAPLRFNIYGQVMTVSGAQITEPDLEFELGRVHIIDHPLYPIPTTDTVSHLRTSYQQLYRLLLDANLVDYLSSGTFTILAPDDDAFGYLSVELKDALATNRTLAERVLLNHVILGSIYTGGITDGMQIETAGGDIITFTTKRGLIFANGIPIVLPDMPFTNGVIHGLNRVLLPEGVENDCHCKPSLDTSHQSQVPRGPTITQTQRPSVVQTPTTRRPNPPPFQRQTPRPVGNQPLSTFQQSRPTVRPNIRPSQPVQPPQRPFNPSRINQTPRPIPPGLQITRSPLDQPGSQTHPEDEVNAVIDPQLPAIGGQKTPPQTQYPTPGRRIQTPQVPQRQTSQWNSRQPTQSPRYPLPAQNTPRTPAPRWSQPTRSFERVTQPALGKVPSQDTGFVSTTSMSHQAMPTRNPQVQTTSWQQRNQVTRARQPTQPRTTSRPLRVPPPPQRRPTQPTRGNFPTPVPVLPQAPDQNFESNRQKPNCRLVNERITPATQGLPICTESHPQGSCQNLPYNPSDSRPLCPNNVNQPTCRMPSEPFNPSDNRPLCTNPTTGQGCRAQGQPTFVGDRRPLCSPSPPTQRGCRDPSSPFNPSDNRPPCNSVNSLNPVSPSQDNSLSPQGCRRSDEPEDGRTLCPNEVQSNCRPFTERPKTGDRRPLCKVNGQSQPPRQNHLNKGQTRPLPQQRPNSLQNNRLPNSQTTRRPSWQSTTRSTQIPNEPQQQGGRPFPPPSVPNTGTFQTQPAQRQPPPSSVSQPQTGLLPNQPLSQGFQPGQSPSSNFQPRQPPSTSFQTGQQPSNSFQPGQPPSTNFQPGQQRPTNFQPGQQRPTNFQPGQPRPTNFQPGQPPSTNFQPGSQPSQPHNTVPQPNLPVPDVPRIIPQQPSPPHSQGPHSQIGGIANTGPFTTTPRNLIQPSISSNIRPNQPFTTRTSPTSAPRHQTNSVTTFPGRVTSTPRVPVSVLGTSTTPGEDSRRTLYEIVEDPALLIRGRPVKLTKVFSLFHKAGLEDLLSGPGPMTMFLPSDDAFATLPKGVVDQLEENPELLRRVLLYHVANLEILPSPNAESYTVPSLEGNQIVITMLNDGRLIFVSGAKAIAVTRASNGIFYVINQFLYPLPHENILGAIISRPDLSTLAWLLPMTGLTDMLQGQTPYTFLAPTDNAFAQLPPAVYEEITQNTTALQEILLNHIVDGAHYGREFLAGVTFPSARGGKLKFQVVSYGYQVNDVNIKTPEIVTGTGVIHLIDQVLLQDKDLRYFRMLDNSLDGQSDSPFEGQQQPQQVGQTPGTGQPSINDQFLPQGQPPSTGLQPPVDQWTAQRIPAGQRTPSSQRPSIQNQRTNSQNVQDGQRTNSQNVQAGQRTNSHNVQAGQRTSVTNSQNLQSWQRTAVTTHSNRITTVQPIHGGRQPTNGQQLQPSRLPGNGNGQPVNVADLARTMGLNRFANWITNTGLLEKVHDGGVYTVFAPTDDAVNSLPQEMANSIDSNPSQTMSLLQYHIVPQTLNLNSVSNDETASTLLQGKKIRFNVYQRAQPDCKQLVTASGTPLGDALATMGSVQMIPVTQVLYQPTGNLLNIIDSSPILQSLSQAIKSARITWILSGSGPLTFFAPSDTAFQSLSPEQRKALIDDKQAFTELLKRHLIRGTYFSSGVQDDMTKNNENGKTTTLSLQEGILTANSVPVIYSDITATNGVLHVIDQFL